MKYIKTPKKVMIKEHIRIVKLLKKYSKHADIKKELSRQKKELRQYKRK